MAFNTSGEVFLNFSAEDIGKNFGAHLNRSLLRAGIHTITGDAAGTDTLTLVQQSRIAVVVFSKNYVTSGSALDELVKIRECTVTTGLVVIPVFYNVDKHSLQNQLETSAGGYEYLRQNQQTGSVSPQRQALEEIAGMPWLNINNFADRDEAACVHKFVEIILSELNIMELTIDRTLSSPSTSSTLHFNDIFISFRRADTHKDFVSYLYKAFTRAGICTFIDEDMVRGEVISEQIEGAIERTKIAVIVFSKNYADSKWCLDELVWINKRRKTGLWLVPAFYDINPTVVRRQTQKYAKAFERHDQQMSDKAQIWREALTEAADISGFAIKCDNGNEAKFIQEITEAVAEKARSLGPELTEATNESTPCFRQTIQNGNESSFIPNITEAVAQKSRSLRPELTVATDESGNEMKIVQKITENVPKVNPIYSSELLSFPSSSSSLTPRWNVFLSFRGVDTRETFISHLYMEMKHANIQVFLDDDALRRGHKIKSGLFSAIQESKILIVVFSKNYASSKWCLDELVEILERQNTQKLENRNTARQLFFPIFYDVNPWDVEKQEGSFGKAFEINNDRYPKEMVDIWRAALSEAGTMQGWDLQNSWDRWEADLIQDVIAKILHIITTN